jgi:hypothetical protein
MNHVGGLVSADGTDLALKLKREPSRSNYTPQGIEIYKGKPILYSTGAFIDDYVVDPAERSNLSFSFIVKFERNCIARIVRTSHAHQRLVRPAGAFLQRAMHPKCDAFGSKILFDDGEGTLEVFLGPEGLQTTGTVVRRFSHGKQSDDSPCDRHLSFERYGHTGGLFTSYPEDLAAPGWWHDV